MERNGKQKDEMEMKNEKRRAIIGIATKAEVDKMSNIYENR